MMDTATVYWFSKEGFEKLNTCYAKLTKRKHTLYSEISECLQMDHHDQQLKVHVEAHGELKRMIEQIDAMKPFIRIIETTSLAKLPLTVQINTVVTLQYDNNEIHTYLLTPYGETNLSKNQISYTTALGSHLLSKYLGEEFDFTHNHFTQTIKILNIQCKDEPNAATTIPSIQKK